MRRITRFLFRVTLALFLLSIGGVLLYRYVPVPVTPLMLRNALSAAVKGNPTTFHHDWVPIEEMSPHLASAVVASEDQRFYQHNGFDWKEIGNAIEERKAGKRKRGGSTISQQTAKNVFTFCSSTWARKAIEAYYTVLIEWLWPKERILEVYLNSLMGEKMDNNFTSGIETLPLISAEVSYDAESGLLTVGPEAIGATVSVYGTDGKHYASQRIKNLTTYVNKRPEGVVLIHVSGKNIRPRILKAMNK